MQASFLNMPIDVSRRTVMGASFPQLSRQYGNAGAGILLVPAWDFVADGWLHSRMTIGSRDGRNGGDDQECSTIGFTP